MKDFLKHLRIVSVKEFYKPNDDEKNQIDSEIENNYLKYAQIYKKIDIHNFPIKDYKTKYFDNLYDKFLKECYTIFGNFTLSPRNKTSCWAYKSTLENYAQIYHNHVNTSTINGVYYYQINEGDSITFLEDDVEYTYFPLQDELLIFPNYLIHRPNIPTGDICRYSINLEIITEENVTTLFSRI